MDFISSWGVYTAYLYILLWARGLAGSRKFNTCSMRAFKSEAVSGSLVPSESRYDPLGSCRTLPSLCMRVLPISYRTSSTSKTSTTSPRFSPLDSRLSAFTAPNPNRANSVAISMVDFPDPTSPCSSTYPGGNSRLSFL